MKDGKRKRKKKGKGRGRVYGERLIQFFFFFFHFRLYLVGKWMGFGEGMYLCRMNQSLELSYENVVCCFCCVFIRTRSML